MPRLAPSNQIAGGAASGRALYYQRKAERYLLLARRTRFAHLTAEGSGRRSSDLHSAIARYVDERADWQSFRSHVVVFPSLTGKPKAKTVCHRSE
jgi:hypothetical protein